MNSLYYPHHDLVENEKLIISLPEEEMLCDALLNRFREGFSLSGISGSKTFSDLRFNRESTETLGRCLF